MDHIYFALKVHRGCRLWLGAVLKQGHRLACLAQFRARGVDGRVRGLVEDFQLQGTHVDIKLGIGCYKGGKICKIDVLNGVRSTTWVRLLI